MKAYIKKCLILVIIIAIIFGARMSPLGDYLTFDALKENKDALQNYVSSNYVFATVAYILLYIVVAALSLPGATILTLAGGFLFGTFFGTIFVNIGATIGAICAFLVARYLLGETIQKKYGDKLKKLNDELSEYGEMYLLTLRFIPLFPFFLVNLAVGLTKIPLRTFVWTTSLGILPGSAIYAFAGSQLGQIDSLEDIVSGKIILAFVLLGLLVLIPVIYKHVQKKKVTY